MLKPGQAMRSLEPEMLTKVFMHAAYQRNIDRVPQLINMLDQCNEPVDYYEFQQLLFSAIYTAQERKAQCSRIVKRLRSGKSLPSDAPSSPELGDPAQLESWELEVFVCEKVVRQLRAVGDGLAWRCFGYDRRLILALSRNASPGEMYGKEGLPYELGTVKELWQEKGNFALLHDITNCLRIADVTEFTDDGKRVLREVKSKLRAHKRPNEKRQMRRAQAAVDAVMNGGDLPGERGGARLVQLEQPHTTSLKRLGDLIQLSKEHGCWGMGLSQGRAIIATSVFDLMACWRDDYDGSVQARLSARRQATEQAGIANGRHHIQGMSADTASRSPIMAPWAIYPLPPEDRAAIICDVIVVESILSVDSLVEELEAAGLRAELLLQPGRELLSGDMEIVRAHWQNRALTLHNDGLAVLLYELVEPSAWAAGIKEVITQSSPIAEPQLVFANESETWVPQR